MKRSLLVLLVFLPVISWAEKAEVVDVEAKVKRLFSDGLFLLKRESYEKAANKFKEVMEQQPKLAEAHNNYAYALRQVDPENYELALKHYNIALKLKPKLAVAYQYRGCLHYLMGNMDLSKADYNVLLKLGEKELAEKLKTFIKEAGMSPKEGGRALTY